MNGGNMTFGEYIQKARERIGLNLREFCRDHGYDPSNYSKVERGFLPAPKDPFALEKLRIELNIEDTQLYWDLADLTRKRIPKDLWKYTDSFIAFFEKLRAERPD